MRPITRLLLTLGLLITFIGSLAVAQKTVHVRTYTRKDGTVVNSYNRTAPGTGRGSTARSTTPSLATPRESYPTVRERTVTVERDGNGRVRRSAVAKHQFMLSHPCPSTGRSSGVCSGYVIDHVKPLACGGADAPSNMQWQTLEAAKAKDKWERAGCR